MNNRRNHLSFIIMVRFCALKSVSLWVFMLGLCVNLLAGQAALAAPAESTVEKQPDIRRDAVVTAIEHVLPTVVNIGTETIVEVRDPYQEMLKDFWGPYYRGKTTQKQTHYSLGSGVIIDEDGYILTNEHVISRASHIWVKLSNEAGATEYEADRVAGSTRVDLALLKLRTNGKEKFKAIDFAHDDDLILGETVIALGNPFGLGGSVSRGILSSKNRRPARDDQALDIADWLQTDAPINPGNSGGPLVDLNGNLIGLNVAVVREGQGIGFAIPVKQIVEALSEQFTPETLKSIWFGARVKPGTLPLNVINVEPESPAEHAGLKPGDLVLRVNNKPVKNFIQFASEIVFVGENKSVNLTVRHNGESRDVSVRLVPESSYFNSDLLRKKLGFKLEEMRPGELAEIKSIGLEKGLIIREVDKTGPASEAGLVAGFVVRTIEDQVPADLVTAARMVNRLKKGDLLKMGIMAKIRVGNRPTYQTGTVELTIQ